MSELVNSLRRLLHGIPSERSRRIQEIRDEIIQQIEANGWDWQEVEESAKIAHADLKNGRLPRTENEVQDTIYMICKKYESNGCSLEDIRDAVDAVQAKASAQQKIGNTTK